MECWCRHLSAGSCGLSTTVRAMPCQCYAKHQYLVSTHSARKNLCKLVCARLNRLEYRVEPGYSLTTTSCLCSTQYFVQANNWCAISGTQAPKLLLCFLSHSHNEKVGKEVGARCKQGEGERLSKAADRVSSFPLIGLHRRKWFTALLSQFTPAVGPDLRQVQIYTRSRFTAATDLHQSHGLCLQWPSGGIYTFSTFFSTAFDQLSSVFASDLELLPFSRHWARACWEGLVVVP